MAVLATLTQVGGVLGLTWWVLGRFKDAHVPPVVHGAVFVSWSLGFLGLLLLPMDITVNGLASLDADSPQAAAASFDIHTAQRPATGTFGSFLDAWEFLYWLTFLMSWMVLPLLAEFRINGEFELKARLLSSVKNLLFHWTILATIGVVVALYLVFVNHLSMRGVVGLAMACANTYGLLWLVALLGYGLVDIPRSFWRLRLPERRLKQLQFNAVHLHEERMEAAFDYDEIRADVDSCYQRMLQAESDSIILTSDMQFVKTCLGQVRALLDQERHLGQPTVGANGLSGTRPVHARTPSLYRKHVTTSIVGQASTGKLSAPTLPEIVALHRRARSSQLELRRCDQAWINLCIHVDELQDQISDCEQLPASCLYPDTSIVNRVRNLSVSLRHQLYSAVTEPVSIACAVLSGAASVCILWGEFTMAWQLPSMSLFRATTHGDSSNSSIVAELLALVLLLYLAVCAYLSLLKLRCFGRYALVSHGNSTELSLLKTSTILCRLQFALGYNVLLMLNDRTVTDRTAFHALFNRMQVVHVFGSSFSVYAPIAMVLLVGFTLGNGYARVMKHLGFEQYEQLMFADPGHLQAVAKGEQLAQKGIERHHALISRKRKAYTGEAKSVYGFSSSTAVARALLDGDDGECMNSIDVN